MTIPAFISFLFLTLSFLSLWIRREPQIWGAFLGLSLLFGLFGGMLFWPGPLLLAGLIALWSFYIKKPNVSLFVILILATICMKLHILPGFRPIPFTPSFKIGLEAAITGLLPLALVVPLSQTKKDWQKVLKGLFLGGVGIAILALLATISGATHLQFKLPSHMAARTWSNLVLTSIPEEGFWRGFMQRGLSRYFHDTKRGKIAALVLTSAIFTFGHIYWTSNLAILGFVFLASLLYGSVYLLSGKVESAIFTHFLLNLIHMTFFEYHAM